MTTVAVPFCGAGYAAFREHLLAHAEREEANLAIISGTRHSCRCCDGDDSDGDGAPVGPASLRLHSLAGEPDNTDRRELDLGGQRLVPVQRCDVGGERRNAVRQRGPVRHDGRAEHRRRLDLRRLGLLAVERGRRVLGRVTR